MKKTTRNILIIAFSAVIIALIAVNRNSVKTQEKMASSMQLQITSLNEEKIYYYSENNDKYTTFVTQMKRRNGEITDRNYSGIQLKDILSEAEINFDENSLVTAVCADLYEVQFTYNEVIADENIYLVTRENGAPLPEEIGTFMLVVNFDEFSTRWAKNIIQVKISEK